MPHLCNLLISNIVFKYCYQCTVDIKLAITLIKSLEGKKCKCRNSRLIICLVFQSESIIKTKFEGIHFYIEEGKI